MCRKIFINPAVKLPEPYFTASVVFYGIKRANLKRLPTLSLFKGLIYSKNRTGKISGPKWINMK